MTTKPTEISLRLGESGLAVSLILSPEVELSGRGDVMPMKVPLMLVNHVDLTGATGFHLVSGRETGLCH